MADLRIAVDDLHVVSIGRVGQGVDGGLGSKIGDAVGEDSLIGGLEGRRRRWGLWRGGGALWGFSG